MLKTDTASQTKDQTDKPALRQAFTVFSQCARLSLEERNSHGEVKVQKKDTTSI